MPSIRPNNPAARLYLILSEAQDCNSQATIKDVWSHVLGTDNASKLWPRVGLIYGLPREIQKQLQRRPDFDTYEMAWWGPLSAHLTYYGSREKWAGIASEITDDVLGAIRLSARTLSRSFPEPILERSVIEELRGYISEIKDSIAAQPVEDEDLADFLSQSLEHIEDLLDDIKIVGAVGVKQNLEAVVDEVNARSDEIKKTLTPQAWEWWERLLSRTQKVFATVAVVSGALGSGVMTVKALSPGPAQLENTQEQSEREPPLNTQEPETQDKNAEDDLLDADFKEI